MSNSRKEELRQLQAKLRDARKWNVHIGGTLFGVHEVEPRAFTDVLQLFQYLGTWCSVAMDRAKALPRYEELRDPVFRFTVEVTHEQI